MNAFKQFWTHYADFSSKTSRAHFWLAFFWNFLLSLPLWVFYIVISLNQQNPKEPLNFSDLHSLLLFSHFSTQSSHLCASFARCRNPLGLDLFKPWARPALFIDGIGYFSICLADCSCFPIDSHDASREIDFPAIRRKFNGRNCQSNCNRGSG